jgi:hypothetical protein
MDSKTLAQKNESDWKRDFPTAVARLSDNITAQFTTALTQLKTFNQKKEAKALAKDLYFNVLKSVLQSIE